MAKLIEKSDVSDARLQGAPSQVGGGSSLRRSSNKRYQKQTLFPPVGHDRILRQPEPIGSENFTQQQPLHASS